MKISILHALWSERVQTYHFFPEESEVLQCAHRLRRRINVAEHDVRLAPHLHRLEGYNVQDDAVGGK